jgi:AcrR family transcriptional regulator
MGDIAGHAGVARSTLHRYFPDRAALTQGIEEFVEGQYEEALAAADVQAGTGYEAFERVVEELQDRIEAFSWWMQIIHAEVDDFDSDPDRQLLEVIARGQADGTIDDQFPPTWIHTMLWTALWTAHKQIVLNGQRPQPIKDATRAALRKITSP